MIIKFIKVILFNHSNKIVLNVQAVDMPLDGIISCDAAGSIKKQMCMGIEFKHEILKFHRSFLSRLRNIRSKIQRAKLYRNIMHESDARVECNFLSQIKVFTLWLQKIVYSI